MTDGISGNSVKKFHKWNLGTINVQTCSDDYKVHSALLECSRANLEVVCMQEVRLLKNGSIRHHGYDFYWNGMQRLKRYGVAIAIRSNPNIIINSIHNISPRIIAADINMHGCKLRIISCYAPTLRDSASSKHLFYRELSKVSRVENHRKLIINGDFNAEPQFCRTHCSYDGRDPQMDNSNGNTNENIMMFLQFCHQHKLSIMNTWYDHPIHHRVTWHHPNVQNTRSKFVYDYCLAQPWIRQHVMDVRVKNSYFHSDHRLVVTKLKTPANKAARLYTRRHTNRTKVDLELLYNNSVLEKVKKSINDHLQQNSCPTSINAIHDHIISALVKGKQQIPPEPKGRRHPIPWQQDSVLEELHYKRVDLRKMTATNDTKTAIKTTNKEIRSRVKVLQNKNLKEKAKHITEAKQHRNLVKMWRHAKQHDSSGLAKSPPIQCPGLKKHFQEHFNPDHSQLIMPPELQDTPEFIHVLRSTNVQIIKDPPANDEIENAIKKLNNGTSALDMEAEILKLALETSLKTNLETYFRQIWIKKETPKQWNISRITPIWKNKGSASDPSKYRAISIGSVLCKVAMNIILKRISSFYDQQLKRTQFGFRTGVGCNDGIFMVKQIQDIASLTQRKLFICFVDLTAAFDHVNRDLMFKSINKRLGENSNDVNINIVQELYKRTVSFLHNQDPEEHTFTTESGVRQGGQEGPPFFNLFFDYVLRVYENRKLAAGINGLCIKYHIPNEATNRAQRAIAPQSGTCDDDNCGYADDLGVLCWSVEDLQKCMDILNCVFSEFGLEINLSKTKTMIMSNDILTEESYPETIISINSKSIDNVSAFKYLGVHISCNNVHIGKPEIDHRVSSSYTAFAQNKKLFTNMNIDLHTRVMFLNSLVRSRLTYGCHTWKPTHQELSKLESTYRYFLRSMIFKGHTRINPPSSSDELCSSDEEDEVDWRYLITNDRLQNITKTESIESFYKKQQSNYVSHIIRQSNLSICKILLFHAEKRTKRGRKTKSFLERVVEASGTSHNEFLKASFEKKNPG